MKSCLIITARSKSSRFKRKILKNFDNKLKSIDILIGRAKKIKKPIIVAISKDKSDNKLCEYIKKNHKVIIFRGSLNNKLKRWHDCFKKFNINRAGIIDGDDILFDFKLYKRILEQKEQFEIKSNNKKMITGLFTHVINIKVFKKIKNFYQKYPNSEMIDKYLKLGKVKIKIAPLKKLYSEKKIRLTFDYVEDFKLLKILIDKFGHLEPSEIYIKYLIKEKKLAKINFFREDFWRENQLKKINRSCNI